MLIVSKADCRCADLKNQVKVLLVMLGKKSVTDFRSVLMSRYASEGIFLTVEEEALFGVNLKGTATEACADVVEHSVALEQFNRCSVEVRVFSAVPEVNVLNFDFNFVILIADCTCDNLTVGKNLIFNLATVILIDIGLDFNNRILALDFGSYHNRG